MLDFLKILDGQSFFFQTQTNCDCGGSTWVQLATTLLATIIGALLAFIATRIGEKRQEHKLRNSLAHSTMYKITRATQNLKGMRTTFFEDVPEGTNDADVWKSVRSTVPIPSPNLSLSPQEFEFLLGDVDAGSPAYDVALLLDYLELSTHACNEYSAQRTRLDTIMAKYVVGLDEIDQVATFEIPNEVRQELEFEKAKVAQLCILLRSNIDANVEHSRNVIIRFNELLPALTKDQNFKKRINFGD